MDSYLYLLELFIEKIYISSNVYDKIKLEQLLVTGEIKKFLRMDIALIKTGEPTNSEQIQFNTGKSSLFAHNCENLHKKLSENPFIISVSINSQVLGQASINWSKEMLQLIKKGPETYGLIGPTSISDVWVLKNKDKIVGDIKATIKLSSFGYNIETTYQFNNKENKILIKGIKDETFFEYQKVNNIGTSSEVLPVPLLTGLSETDELQSKCSMQPVSLFALYKSNLETKVSPSNIFNLISTSHVLNQVQTTLSSQTFDIVSIVERPKERKLTDIRQYQDISKFPFKVDSTIYKTENGSSEQFSNMSNYLTKDRINELLCKNKDCPAAKKFKEFGLGPLASTQNLGAPLKDAIPPVSYGLSQTYGVFDNYGPYGLFMHPNKANDPFVPKKDNNWIDACWKPKRKHNIVNKHCCTQAPLRLTGGGVFDYNDLKSPFDECKDIMQQLDTLIHKYKQALGPCGKTTCPFAPNITKQTCNKICNKTSNVALSGNKQPTEEVIVTKKLEGAPACESAKCAYAKYKLGLNDEDAMIELQYLPPAVSGKCGQSKCPYPIQPNLPPIHWDCPEPLPKDICKNSNCPYLPKDIKCFNSVLSKSPCGNKACPYSPPQPCFAPSCPFTSKKCPYEEENKCFNNICTDPNSANLSPPGHTICNNFSETINILLKNLLKAHNINIPTLCFGGPQCPYNKDKNEITPNKFTKKTSNSCLPPINNDNNKNCCLSAESESLHKNSLEDFTCNNPDCAYAEKSEEDKNISDNCCNVEINPCCLHLLTYYYPYLTCVLETLQHLNTKQEKNVQNKNGEKSTYDACFYEDKEDKLSLIDYVSHTIHDQDYAPCTKGACKESGGELSSDACPCSTNQHDVSKNISDTKDDKLSSIDYISDTIENHDNAPCSKGTCKASGGELVCDSCPCGQSNADSKVKIGKGKRKAKGKFVYSIGDKYPGVKIGHRTCVLPGPNVPASMGWLWNIRSICPQLKPRRGWRPGAIARTIALRIRAHREAQGIGMLELKRIQDKKYAKYKSDTTINVNPRPTLQIKKREGCYWITMNPLKDPYSLVENEDPYVDCTPLQFKIEKNKDKKKNPTAEYQSCFCGDDNEIDVKLLSSSSSESELDIEFTPPAGIIHPERFKRKKNVVHCDTQYMATDFATKAQKSCESVKAEPKNKKGKKSKGKKANKKK